MGVRTMPYTEANGKPQFAGMGSGGTGGGGSYTLPTATALRLGGVKIGSGVNVSDDGTISVSGGGGGSTPAFITGTEQKIGTLDGEELYKGFYKITSSSSSTTSYKIPIANVKWVYSVSVSLYMSSGANTGNKVDKIGCEYYDGQLRITLSSGFQATDQHPLIAVVEFTKTSN